MSRIQKLSDLGQSIWYDYIRRSFITSGELQRLIDEGLKGVTSNPSIFEKAIAGSRDYDEDLKRLVKQKKSVAEIYEALVLGDITLAADLLLPVYESTGGGDGYVSLEVSPTLAHDTEGTVAEARRLFAVLRRPNVMIKVPATAAGIPAIQQLIGDGINVNVTLIFGLDHYQPVAEAYLAGLENLLSKSSNLDGVASVASFFVSRVDSAVDRILAEKGFTSLQGKIAIANSKVAYQKYRELFSGPRWEKLAARGARVQRLLWASTGTKNPLYPDTLYVDSLIGPDTVNTVPPSTLNAFRDHGTPALTLTEGLEEAKQQLLQLEERYIDLQAITQRLQEEGVQAFARSFETLLDSIAEKQKLLLSGKKVITVSLGEFQSSLEAALVRLRDQNIMSRIWAHDYTVWKENPSEIHNRLGWLHSPEMTMDTVQEIDALVDEIRREGFTRTLLLGMGGSSLAAEVFRFTFGVRWGYLDLAVLDSTDPGAVLTCAQNHDPAKTLFIVSTKSGRTEETLSFMKYFYNRVSESVGRERAGHHFIAITDPESCLEAMAKDLKFRKIFLNDPNIGGRYSVLSYFGLVPARLIGIDLEKLLERATTMACNCEGCNCPVAGDNSGARLGAIMGVMADAGRDKLTLITSPSISAFGAWVEQLIAESTGKDGKGILPVTGETLADPGAYARDRLFVYLRLNGDDTHDARIDALQDAGHPVVQIHLRDLYDLGGEFFRWEMATAIVGFFLGINPFDQPNVESAKVLARKMIAAYREKGKLPETAPTLEEDDITVFAEFEASSVHEALRRFLSDAQEGQNGILGRSYVALQAFIQPTTETEVALQVLRTKIQTHSRMATTVGYGPRFLHSTGQLHKGDAGHGLFIQITANIIEDIPIPDQPGANDSTISFGILKTAQALGDRQALLEAGRKVITFHLGTDVIQGLRQLSKVLP